jgi:hypothetical protein
MEGLEMNKRTLIIASALALVFLFVSSSFGQSSQVLYGWTKIMGGTSYDQGLGIATDFSNNIYVSGYFQGTVNFGHDFGTTDIKTSAGYADIYVTKTNANGTYGWTKIIGGTGGDYGFAITTDSSGNVYVSGYFQGTVNFGHDFGTTDIKTSVAQEDIFISKINANGTYGWTKIMGGANHDIGFAIAADSSGNVYVTGSFDGTVNFGHDFGTTDIKTSAGYDDIYVTKINANGSYGWTKVMGGTLSDGGHAITTDSSGDVCVTGYFSGSVNFGLDFGATDVKTSSGLYDIFIVKLESGEAVMPPENPAISRVVNNYIFYKEFINRVSWQAPSNQPVPIAKYIIYRTPLGEGNFIQVAEVEASIFKYEDRGLRKNELYTYRITSVDIYGRESRPVEVNNSGASAVEISLGFPAALRTASGR